MAHLDALRVSAAKLSMKSWASSCAGMPCLSGALQLSAGLRYAATGAAPTSALRLDSKTAWERGAADERGDMLTLGT